MRTQVQLTEEQFQALKILAVDRDVSLSDLICQEAEEFIATSRGISFSERCERATDLTGHFRSGNIGETVSAEHDKYLTNSYFS